MSRRLVLRSNSSRSAFCKEPPRCADVIPLWSGGHSLTILLLEVRETAEKARPVRVTWH